MFQEKFKQLLDLQEKLGSEVDLIGPTTEILKEGPVIKISARNGQHYERYLFLVRKQALHLFEYQVFHMPWDREFPEIVMK